MSFYRLKPEAVQFFKKDLSTRICELDDWSKHYGVDLNALEKVEPAYLTYGHRTSDNSSTLGGWSSEKGSEFCFTVHFPSIKNMEYDKFNKGKMTRDLMNKIQNQINYFYNDFNDSLSESDS